MDSVNWIYIKHSKRDKFVDVAQRLIAVYHSYV